MVLILCYIFILFLAVLLMKKLGLWEKDLASFGFVLLLGVALAFRYFSMDYVTADYSTFLARWVDYFRESNGFFGFRQAIGNYNVPYLYFLAAFSYIDYSDLYLIKLLSVAFELILAYFTAALTGLFTQSRAIRAAAFIGVFWLPTVFLNGAYWGQCDVIYTAFAVMALYFMFRDRPYPAMAALACSLGFKLQAVFIFPIFFAFLLQDRLKLRHLLVFPVTYFLLMLPAVLFGRPLGETLLFYLTNATSAGSGLNYNSASIFAFPFLNGNQAALSNLGIAAAAALVMLVCCLLFISRKKLSDDAILTATLLLVAGIPLLLPHMHDRYFFIADVLSLAFALLNRRCFPVPFLITWASLLGYHAYLKGRYFLPMWYGTIALLAACAILVIRLLRQLPLSDSDDEPDTADAEE